MRHKLYHPTLKMTVSFLLVCLISQTIFCNFTSGDVSMAIIDVQRMIDSEQKIVNILELLLQAEEEKVTAIKSYINWFADFTKVDNIERAVSHPVNAFHLIRHLSVDWENLRQTLTYNLGQAAAIDVELERATTNFPNREEDIKSAALGILRLQKTYQIDSESFANGKIHEVQAAMPLTALDCYLIGRVLAKEHDVQDFAISWLEIALDKLEKGNESVTSGIRKVDILDWLQYAYFKNGDILTALALLKIIEETELDFPLLRQTTEHYIQKLQNLTIDQLDILKNHTYPPKLKFGGHYESLCRGEGKPNILDSLLNCYYMTHNNSYLILQPIKYEIVHRDPDVFILHDVMRQSEIERIKCISYPYIRSEMVQDPESNQQKLSKVRVSKRAHLDQSVDPIVKKLNLLSGHYANLNASQAEPLHITNYGIGGYFTPHFDFYTPPGGPAPKELEPHLGDNIATFMVYLTDVEAGGATVFPELNVTLIPEKGSAALWYNQHLDGTGDTRTVHSGCPILFGSKWIMNKWFRQVQQDVTRPCALHQDSPDTEMKYDKNFPTFQHKK